MSFKVLILISFLTINIHSILGQQGKVRCLFQDSKEHGYTCVLELMKSDSVNDDVEGVHLPGKTDEDVRRVEGNWQDLVNIPPLICNVYINTEDIDLNSCLIERVRESSFKGCKRLKSLKLERNQISQIDENAFLENPELENIELWSNQLTTLPGNLFINQQKLQNLAIDSNRIVNLPNNIFKSLKSLKTINLSENRIPALNPAWFETLDNLENLYLHFNQIEDLPVGIFTHMSKLTQFSIYSNRLRVIHSHSFGLHPTLQFAWLQMNQIEAIDEKFILNTSVSEISMNFNVCAHGTIVDNTFSRVIMRIALRTCFENYEKLMTGPLSKLLIDRDLSSKVNV
ncbi:hypothetical protein ACKWTF_001557 [Chironomus riparius]